MPGTQLRKETLVLELPKASQSRELAVSLGTEQRVTPGCRSSSLLLSAQDGGSHRKEGPATSSSQAHTLRAVLRSLRGGLWEKVGGPRQGKEIPLVRSEKDTPQLSPLLGHFYLFRKDASTRHLLSAGASQTRHPHHAPAMGEVGCGRLLHSAGPGRDVCDPQRTSSRASTKG